MTIGKAHLPVKPLRSLYFRLPTEQPNPVSHRLDRLGVLEAVRLVQRENLSVLKAVRSTDRAIAKGVEILVRGFERGGRLWLVGAGTSGRLGVMEAAECPPTFGTRPSLVQAVMAGGRGSVFRSKEGAEDRAADGRRQIHRRARAGDVVAGIAASGITPFVRGALGEARRKGCRTVLITSNPSVGSSRIADGVICPRVGPEILSGSTRMKAGTAAKLVLNTLTTVAMVRLGKTYKNWMVDLKPASRKLRFRAIRLISVLGKVDPRRAERIFRISHGNTKAGIVMARLGVSYPQALKGLRKAGGFLRRILEP